MLKKPYLRIVQFLDEKREMGLLHAVKKSIYLEGEAIIVKKNTAESKTNRDILLKKNLRVINITKQNIESLDLKYPVKNRYLKVLNNLEKGYECVAIVRGNEILGDVWYVTAKDSSWDLEHPDLKLFEINLNRDEAYAFDMFLQPGERGGALGTPLLGNLLYELRKKGISKSYGFYMKDNIQALWVHRMLKYEECKKMKMKRFFTLRKATNI